MTEALIESAGLVIEPEYADEEYLTDEDREWAAGLNQNNPTYMAQIHSLTA
jgi:hypothetical protein